MKVPGTARSALAGPDPKKGQAMPTIKNIREKVQRKLNFKGQALRKARNETARQKWGDYFIVDVYDRVILTNIDLTVLAKELGVLKPGEKIEE